LLRPPPLSQTFRSKSDDGWVTQGVLTIQRNRGGFLRQTVKGVFSGL
jgi:hypothetical protein